MNGKYQVGSGRVVTVTHDTPFIENIMPQDEPKVKKQLKKDSNSDNVESIEVTFKGKPFWIAMGALFNMEHDETRAHAII